VPHARLGTCAGDRRPSIIERALLVQSRNRRVDVLLLELTPCQPGAQLRLGELATGEQGETSDVGPLGAVRNYPPKRVISGPACATVAIWSRDISAVVAIP